MNTDYWIQYWNRNELLRNSNKQAQVGRTRFGQPIDKAVWGRTCEYIREQLNFGKDRNLLDLCCGNGLLEEYLASHFQSIVAVDVSSPLLENFVTDDENIIKIQADVTEFRIGEREYDNIVLYFAAQHFEEMPLLDLIRRAHRGLRSGGKLFIGDIPDVRRRWDFYSSTANKAFYFHALENSDPHIGYWHDSFFFRYVSDYIGYGDFAILEQPKYQINSGYRFDVVYTK